MKTFQELLQVRAPKKKNDTPRTFRCIYQRSEIRRYC